MRVPDESLNHWADVYVRLGLAARHITLEEFLARPRELLLRHRLSEAAMPRPAVKRGVFSRLFGGLRCVHDH